MANKSFQEILQGQRKDKVKEQVAISQAAQTYALQQQSAVTKEYQNDISNKRIGNEAFNMVRDFVSSMDGLADASGFVEFRSTMEEWKVLLAELGSAGDTGVGKFSNPEKEYVGKIISSTLAEVYPMANVFTRMKFGFKDLIKQFKPLKMAQRVLGGVPLIGGMIERKIATQEAGEGRLRGAEKTKARAAGVASRKDLQREIDVATGEDVGVAGLEEIEKERPAGVGAGLKTLKKGAAGEEQREELIAKEEEQHTEIVDKLDAIVSNTGKDGVVGKSTGKGGIFDTMFKGIKNNFGKIAAGLTALKFGPKILKSVVPKILTKAATTLGIKTTAKTVAPAAAKVAAKTGATAASKIVAKEVTETAAKTGTKVVAKTAGKTLLKSAIKKIPVIGLLAGLGFGLHKLAKGDFTGAAMEVSSGAMAMVPGIGTAGSVAMDVAIAKHDIDKAKALAETGEVSDGAIEEVATTQAVADEKVNESAYIKKVSKRKKYKRGQIINTEPTIPDVIAANLVTIESKRTNVRANLETATIENMLEKILPKKAENNNTVISPNNTISTSSSTQILPSLLNKNIDDTILALKAVY